MLCDQLEARDGECVREMLEGWDGEGVKEMQEGGDMGAYVYV